MSARNTSRRILNGAAFRQLYNVLELPLQYFLKMTYWKNFRLRFSSHFGCILQRRHICIVSVFPDVILEKQIISSKRLEMTPNTHKLGHCESAKILADAFRRIWWVFQTYLKLHITFTYDTVETYKWLCFLLAFSRFSDLKRPESQ